MSTDPDASSFAALGIAEPLCAAVRDAGYTAPTPIQAEAIPIALRGRDIMGLAQTGTGKTAAFTLPILQRLLDGPRRTRALVLTPTRELAMQVDESFTKYARHSGLDVVAVFGGVPLEPQEERLRAGVDVVVATPGRLLDHLERQNVVFDDLEVLVLDEADRMLDMGFAPQINRVVDQIPPYRQTLLFSATMPPEVEALARKYLRRPLVVQVGRRSGVATTVQHAVYPVPRARKSELLVMLLRRHREADAARAAALAAAATADGGDGADAAPANGAGGADAAPANGAGGMQSVLVFTRTKHGADRVVRDLEAAGIEAVALHADKSQGERTRALEQFRSGEIAVLVATDIAQRGLDISSISHVVNFDVPQAPEDYVHRIGRTGRAAASGDAYTFMAPDEIATVRMIEHVIGQRIPRVSEAGYDFGTVAAD